MKSLSSACARSVAIAATLVLGGLPLATYAGSIMGSLGVNATISNNCVFGTSMMAFGTYDPVDTNASSPLEATGNVNLTCTKSDAITLTADAGLNGGDASGSCATSTCTRALKNGADYLSYDLYTSSGYSTVWNTSNAIDATATGSSQSVDVYGYIPAGSIQPAGTYDDTVQVTATF